MFANTLNGFAANLTLKTSHNNNDGDDVGGEGFWTHAYLYYV